MADDLLLVGSIPYDTAEETFRAVGPALGEHLSYLPDGEVGERLHWVTWIAYRMFHGHPDIETVQRPAPIDGVEQRVGTDLTNTWQFKLKDGVKELKFSEPGWRMGYARDAVNSWGIFKGLKNEGVIPGHVRFQVCLPLPASACMIYFRQQPGDGDIVMRGIAEALKRELATILHFIPHDELAIQWDCAIEDTLIERALTEHGGPGPEVQKVADNIFANTGYLSADIPAEVKLGVHACYGTAEGWPTRRPKDLTGCMILLNTAAATAGRPVDFVHMPTLDSADGSHVAPLADLDVGGARVYVGLVHALHGRDGMKAQMEHVARYVPDFGVAAPCGFGRGPAEMSDVKGLSTPREWMDGLIADQLEAVKLLHEVLGK